jgi:hypothetical protein
MECASHPASESCGAVWYVCVWGGGGLHCVCVCVCMCVCVCVRVCDVCDTV